MIDGESLMDTRLPAICSSQSRRKFGFDGDEVIEVLNVKQPVEMFGSFGPEDGVFPAYHMNKLHWVSILLPDAPPDMVRFLLYASYESTRPAPKRAKR